MLLSFAPALTGARWVVSAPTAFRLRTIFSARPHIVLVAARNEAIIPAGSSIIKVRNVDNELPSRPEEPGAPAFPANHIA